MDIVSIARLNSIFFFSFSIHHKSSSASVTLRASTFCSVFSLIFTSLHSTSLQSFFRRFSSWHSCTCFTTAAASSFCPSHFIYSATKYILLLLLGTLPSCAYFFFFFFFYHFLDTRFGPCLCIMPSSDSILFVRGFRLLLFSPLSLSRGSIPGFSRTARRYCFAPGLPRTHHPSITYHSPLSWIPPTYYLHPPPPSPFPYSLSSFVYTIRTVHVIEMSIPTPPSHLPPLPRLQLSIEHLLLS